MITQFGALPWRMDPERGLQILLITSRDTGRWVIPRGNPIAQLRGHETAAREALEEAGLEGIVSPKPIGRYRYDKQREDEAILAEVTVYPLEVRRQLDDWPERHERRSRWFEPAKAASAVDEPELRALILAFAEDHAA